MTTQLLSDEVQQQIASHALHWQERAGMAALETAEALRAPSVLFRPTLSIDGDHWCALYGDNLQDGVAGFGKSPDEAMWDFDRNWTAKLGKGEPT